MHLFAAFVFASDAVCYTVVICIRVRSLSESELNKNCPPVPSLPLCTYVHTYTSIYKEACSAKVHTHRVQSRRHEVMIRERQREYISQIGSVISCSTCWINPKKGHCFFFVLCCFFEGGLYNMPIELQNSPRSLIKKTAQGHNLTL